MKNDAREKRGARHAKQDGGQLVPNEASWRERRLIQGQPSVVITAPKLQINACSKRRLQSYDLFAAGICCPRWRMRGSGRHGKLCGFRLPFRDLHPAPPAGKIAGNGGVPGVHRRHPRGESGNRPRARAAL